MKTNISKAQVLSIVALLGAAGGAFAQTSPVRPAYSFPSLESARNDGMASVRVGESPFYVGPYVGIALGRDDNLLLSPNNELDSGYAIYTAGAKVDARNENSVFQLGYVVNAGRYNSSDNDNYVDQTLRSSYDYAFSPRSFLRVGYDYMRWHDARGSTDRGISNEPDKYRVSQPSAVYSFGAPGAQGRFEAFYTYGDKEYLNNRQVTVNSDKKTQDYGGAFYWRVAPKTSLLVEARGTDIDYKLSSSPFSGSEARYYVGATWDATAATSGTIKVGRLEKKFDSNLPSESTGSYEGIISWLPRTYSKFDFFAARTTNDSTGLGNFILTDMGGVTWTHAWNSVVSTEAGVRYTKDRYQGFDRTDETTALGLKATYKFRRWLSLGAEWNYYNRDSNIPQYEYDRNIWLLTATGTL